MTKFSNFKLARLSFSKKNFGGRGEEKILRHILAYTLKDRTRLKDTSSRDMSQFRQTQETTTNVYPKVIQRGGVTKRWTKLTISQRVLDIFQSHRVARRLCGAMATHSSLLLADTGKYLRTRQEIIF